MPCGSDPLPKWKIPFSKPESTGDMVFPQLDIKAIKKIDSNLYLIILICIENNFV